MKKPTFALRCFAHCIQGQRIHMEDYFRIAYQKKTCSHQQNVHQSKNIEGSEEIRDDINQAPKVIYKKHVDYVYFGIFDGHGGEEAAKFAQQFLLEFIVKQEDFWKTDDESILRAIKNGFIEVHNAMLRELPYWPKTIRNLPSTSGTTASVLFIKNGKYYTGHVGDSRIVLGSENPESRQWIAKSLTVDHKPESREEKKRIQEAGGAVHNKSGVDRVVWQKPILKPEFDREDSEVPNVYPIRKDAVLAYAIIPFLAVARSLGDLWSINSTTGKYVVSPEPDVAVQPMGPNDKTIILASDGLWNMVSSADAVRLTQELSEQTHKHMLEDFYIVDKKDIAQSLVYYAYQQWTSRNLRSDNTSAIVVLLEEPEVRHSCSEYRQIRMCKDCSCNNNDKFAVSPIDKEQAIDATIDRYRFKGSFDLIDFHSEYAEIDFYESARTESTLRRDVTLPPKLSGLTPPLSHLMIASSYTRQLKLTNGSTITIYTLPSDETQEPPRMKSVLKGKMIRNAFTQANRVASQSSGDNRNESSRITIENASSPFQKKSIIPDVWSSPSKVMKDADDFASSKKENTIITEIQKVVQRVSPSEVGSIKRKFEGSGLDSIAIPCLVEPMTVSPIKAPNEMRYDMRRRMLESSNGENLNRAQPNLRGRPRKRIRVGSTSPTSKYSPPYRHLRSLSLRKSHPQSNKHHQKQSIKSPPRASSVMARNVRTSNISNKLPKTRLRPRHSQRLPRRTT